MKIRQWLRKELDAQRQWIFEHGGTLAGYIVRYGSASDPEHYGNGGEAIYAADLERLHNIEFRLEQRVR